MQNMQKNGILFKMKDFISIPNESEKAVLGAMIANPKTISFFIENIKPKDFLNKQHKVIYKVIQYLFFQSAPIDLVSISETLKASGKLQECGGAVYLAELITQD